MTDAHIAKWPARLCALLGVLTLVAAGCDRGATPAGRPAGPASASPASVASPAAVAVHAPGPGPRLAPLIVVGIDGWEWNVALRLLQAGELPVLARLMERGRYGLLNTITPTLSPVIWTTVATGKTLEHHGILNFTRRESDGRERLFHNGDRQTKALWNILSDYGVRVAVTGWWVTYPVEPVNGVMVAQTNTDAEGGIWKGQLIRGKPGQVYPPERQDGVMAVLDQAEADLPRLLPEMFGEFPHPLDARQQRNWEKTQWAFRADLTYQRIARELLAERPPYDVLMLYFGGADVTGHRFWWYMQPAVYKSAPSAEELANFGRIIPDYYRHIDRMLGELVAAAPPDANWLLFADHGMVPMRQARAFFSAGHTNNPAGMFVAAGPAIAPLAPDRPAAQVQPGDLQAVGSVLDITPTLLAGLRIPIGRDMTGRVLAELFTAGFDIGSQPEPIATHDTPEFLAQRPRISDVEPDQDERMDQLRSLGYLGGTPDDDDPEESEASPGDEGEAGEEEADAAKEEADAAGKEAPPTEPRP